MKYLLLAAGFVVTFAAGLILGIVISTSGAESDASSPRTVTVEKTVAVKKTDKMPKQATATATASASALAEPSMTCQLDKECNLELSSVNVTGAQKVGVLKSDFYQSKRGNFVVVDFTYTWNGGAPVDLDEPSWIVRDSQGRSYTYDFDATNWYVPDGRDATYAEVMPGVPKQGRVIFEVASDSEGFTLVINDLAKPQESKSAKIVL